MKYTRLRFAEGFRVIFGNRRAQVAETVIEPGDAEGGPSNRHRAADQWLYVVERKAYTKAGEELPAARRD